jgi:Tfp pilus assembly protein PilF
VLEEEEEYDQAFAKYQKAIELNPRSADAYNNLGSVLDEKTTMKTLSRTTTR